MAPVQHPAQPPTGDGRLALSLRLAPARRAIDMAGTASSTRPGLVLVVDDDDQVRGLLKQLLTSRGYTALTATGGYEALELLRHHGGDIGLALIDVLMPGADGPAVLAALRQLQPALRACFLTSYAGGYTEAELLEHGAAAVLYKPFQVDELLALVTQLLP